MVRWFSFFLVAYTVAVWAMIEWSTVFGSLLSEWRAEYFDENGVAAGSMKFRTDQGRFFQAVALPWGLMAYPAAVLGALSLGFRLGTRKSLSSKQSRLLALLLVLILARFIHLGVFSTVMASL